jgi:hypothetical protein
MGLALVFYVPMLVGAVFLRPPGELLVTDWYRLGYALAAAVAGTAVLIYGSGWVAHRTAWGRRLHVEFRLALGPLTSDEILVLALLSGFGEEILFRGVLLGRIGLVWSSLLFAAMHFPFRRSLWPWTVFAGVIGVVLAGVTQWAQSLWPAIFIHLTVNYFNLHDIVERDA